MSVHAKKISPEWRKAFAEFERHTGYEIMYQDEIDAGTMTPKEAWQNNLRWLEDHLTETQRIRTPE